MVIYILTKFGADWLIFVDSRVLTSKLWTDGRRTDGQRRAVSDHNSTLSTPCSGELKTYISFTTNLHFLMTSPKIRKIPPKSARDLDGGTQTVMTSF